MRYILKDPVQYRTLSGVDMLYTCIDIETDEHNHTSLVMTTAHALSPQLEVTLTVSGIKTPYGLMILKQNEKCAEISQELIRREILIPAEYHKTVRLGLADYICYRLNEERWLRRENRIR